ncbi:uncharacterized protein LOC131057764 isoform X2 [Cryptomeria japonica]|uniref:uncharacterized protein LOC131057764 isoform X2 n=1 Tax=Cryptomeria japonica TaxID=3369 RepID=UPI0027D9F1CA|nr:uncharacterized protein LOC131057764 isoform X2 [Cryptomeria japonica]
MYMEHCRASLLQFHHKPTSKAYPNANSCRFVSKNEIKQTSKVMKMGLAVALAWQLGCGTTIASQLEKDPVQPFTIYGSISKKYCIEQLVDGKVIGRKKGLTANVCRETLELQRLPIDVKVFLTCFGHWIFHLFRKVNIIGDPSCEKGEGQTKEDSCIVPCKKACNVAISRHLAGVKKETGYILDETDMSKVVDSCSTRCFNECLKSGKSISFVYIYRPPR